MPNTLSNIVLNARDAAKTAKNLLGDVKVEEVMTSIANGASKAIYYFPILVSDNVSQKSAFMLSENLQYMYAYFVRACFSLCPAIKLDLKDNETLNVEKYLKVFHKNMGMKSSAYSLTIESTDLEAFKLFPNETLNEAAPAVGSFEDRTKADHDRKVKEEEDEKNAKAKIMEATATWSAGSIEKANASNPLTVPASCTFLIDRHEVKVDIPVGIKTIIHKIDSFDSNDRIIDEIKGNSTLHSLVRWTTGEVDSLSDILFSTKDMRKDISGNNELNKWMDIVTRRKILNKLSLGLLSKKPYLPNMSIIISMDDVDEIERKTNINLLKNLRYAYKFLKNCLLLSFVIVDEINETAYILYDGHGSFEEVPFNSIKRDSDQQKKAIDRILKVFA